MKLFKSLISPILSYGSEAWGPFIMKGLENTNLMHLCGKPVLENIHIKLCKYVLGVHRKATNAAVIAELRSYPILIYSGTWLKGPPLGPVKSGPL